MTYVLIEKRSLFARTTSRFGKCSHLLKVVFKSYCLCMYDLALWQCYTLSVINNHNSFYYRCTVAQPRFQSWGPIPWSRLLYRTKYGWYTHPVSCTAVCYVTVITLFIKKVGVVRPNFGGSDPRLPSGCALAGALKLCRLKRRHTKSMF